MVFKEFNKLYIYYTVIVILQGDGLYFKGFMIQGRVRENDFPTGNFSAGISYKHLCFGNVGIY